MVTCVFVCKLGFSSLYNDYKYNNTVVGIVPQEGLGLLSFKKHITSINPAQLVAN